MAVAETARPLRSRRSLIAAHQRAGRRPVEVPGSERWPSTPLAGPTGAASAAASASSKPPSASCGAKRHDNRPRAHSEAPGKRRAHRAGRLAGGGAVAGADEVSPGRRRGPRALPWTPTQTRPWCGAWLASAASTESRGSFWSDPQRRASLGARWAVFNPIASGQRGARRQRRGGDQ